MPNEDKATRYHRRHRRAAAASAGLAAAFMLLLLVTGASATLRDAVGALLGQWFVSSVAGYVIAVAVLHELMQLPLAFYRGVTLERRYGLSTHTVATWWVGYLKAWVVALACAVAGALLVWSLLRWSPDHWWIAAGVLFAAMLVGLAQLAPVVLLPMFYDVRPLQRAALSARLTALARRADTRVIGVFEWRVSHGTRKAHAALAGVGRTRRILLSDTLLAEHSDEEIEVIVAHELGHHVHRDIWSAILVDAALVVLGFFAADRLLSAFATSFDLQGKDDIAGLPLLVLALGLVSVALLPLANACSRRHERRADRYALDVTCNVAAFVSAVRRLAAQNLAEDRPSRLVQMLFHTHPSTASRIEAARVWAAARIRSQTR